MMTTSEDDLGGRVFGARFRVVRAIKQGGMGAVYVAVDNHAGDREVALKVVRRTLADDPDAIARFKRETRLLATLQDEHVVTAIDAGEDGGVLWIAMELLDGVSLRESLEQRGRWTWPRTLPVVRQLALALGAAHGLGIIHRDLKPENVMLVDGGRTTPRRFFRPASSCSTLAWPSSAAATTTGAPTRPAPASCSVRPATSPPRR
jgi:serine/threonine-protein kinase